MSADAGAVAASPEPGEAAPARRRRGPSGIFGFILRRVLLGILTLFLISLVIFGATQALPSDPAQARLGKDATPESLAALREELGLNRPAWQQYTDWLSGLFHGDLGDSLTAERPITEQYGDAMVNSGFLVFTSAVLSIPLSLLLGALSAIRRDRLFDTGSSFLTLILAAVPEFVVGIALVVLFATTVWHILPAVAIIGPDERPWDQWKSVILPTVTLVIAVVPYVSRIARASMLEVLDSEYVEMARLKGLSERTVVWRHAMPNALGPTFQVIALNLAYLAGGVIVVEAVFNYQGIGLGLKEAVLNRDFPVVQALGLLIAAVYVVTNLIADVATILVTPRLRTRL